MKKEEKTLSTENPSAPLLNQPQAAVPQQRETANEPVEESAASDAETTPDIHDIPRKEENTEVQPSPAVAPEAAVAPVHDPEELRRLIEKAEKEAYARGRAEAVDEYLNPNPFFSGLHGAESATPADPDLQRILQTRRHVW